MQLVQKDKTKAFPPLISSACVGQYMLKQQNIDDDWI